MLLSKYKWNSFSKRNWRMYL